MNILHLFDPKSRPQARRVADKNPEAEIQECHDDEEVYEAPVELIPAVDIISIVNATEFKEKETIGLKEWSDRLEAIKV